jgi:hypothetical protein
MKALWHSTKPSLLKSWHPWSGGMWIGETVFTCIYMGKIFLKSSHEEPLRQKSWNLHETFWHCTKASLLKLWPLGVEWNHNRGNCFYMCFHKKLYDLVQGQTFNIGKIFLYGPRLLRWAMWPMGLLLISRSNTNVKVARSNFWYPRKCLVTRNTHAKCQSPSTCQSKYIA